MNVYFTDLSPSGHQARLLTGRFQPFTPSQSLGNISYKKDDIVHHSVIMKLQFTSPYRASKTKRAEKKLHLCIPHCGFMKMIRHGLTSDTS